MHDEYAHNAVCCMSWKVKFSFRRGGGRWGTWHGPLGMALSFWIFLFKVYWTWELKLPEKTRSEFLSCTRSGIFLNNLENIYHFLSCSGAKILLRRVNNNDDAWISTFIPVVLRYTVDDDDDDDDDDRHLYRANSMWICSNARNKQIRSKLNITSGGRLTNWLFTQRREVEFGATKDKSI